MLTLDTHILLYALSGRLTEKERLVLEADSEWSVSAIVLWEIEMLHQRKRIRHGLDHPAMAAALARIQVWPISREVCLGLRSLDFQSDPADEVIAATSLVHALALVTRDERIRGSRVVRCV